MFVRSLFLVGILLATGHARPTSSVRSRSRSARAAYRKRSNGPKIARTPMNTMPPTPWRSSAFRSSTSTPAFAPIVPTRISCGRRRRLRFPPASIAFSCGPGAGRLSIDGQVLLTTPFVHVITDGHWRNPASYLDLGPDFRFAPPGNRETWTTFVSKGQTHRVVLETIVGGKRGGGIMRQELGETVAAVSFAGSESFRLIAPGIVIPYTDAGWKDFETAETDRLAAMEAERRTARVRQAREAWASAAMKRSNGWPRRRSRMCRPLPRDMPAHNAIDHFLDDSIAAAFGSGRSRARRPSITPSRFGRSFGRSASLAIKATKSRASYVSITARIRPQRRPSGTPPLVPGDPDKSATDRPHHERCRRRKDAAAGPGADRRGNRAPAPVDQGGRTPRHRRRQAATDPGLADDLTFLRRVTLDTVGVIPDGGGNRAFSRGQRPTEAHARHRSAAGRPALGRSLGRLLAGRAGREPEHPQSDAEQHRPVPLVDLRALLDNKPMDLFVTELVRMRGSHYLGGPAGFAMASQNDVPMAEKAAILASAFLGVQMKCARCHDAPAHKSTQQDLFQLAAMLGEEAAHRARNEQRAARQASRPGPQAAHHGHAQAGHEGRAGVAFSAGSLGNRPMTPAKGATSWRCS